MRKYILVILLVLMTLLAGCWDKVEMDQRSIVLGAAVDLVAQDDKPLDQYMLTLETMAKDLFNADPRNSKSISKFIKEQQIQESKTSRFINMDLITFLKKLAEGGNFLLGSIAVSENGNLRISGSGVIKEGRLIGWLDEEETRTAHYVTGEAKGSEMVVQDPEKQGSFITLELSSAKSQIKAVMIDSIPNFSINVKLK